ncbi:hypothetical protein [Antarcticimicrobium sediminis]|uniref:Uncharacterized protein n=1 Tax=Antarcticimicrobium sediminis TaxID=2546227 RepID=A0A4R5F0G6_9RHOB|nr:hypothetical protein [Antarcticimicrobium sediminis]TDE40958.1 hypothetical protein E1B25_01730 [Antarcticimicrobium sediminis]
MTEAHIPDDHIRNAFSALDRILGEMVTLHAMVSALEGVARGTTTFSERDAISVLERLEVVAVDFGVLRSHLTELRLHIPEDQS